MDGSSGPLSDHASWASANSPAHPGPTAPLGLKTSLDTDMTNASSRSLRTLLPVPLDEGGKVNHPAKKKPLAGRVQVAAACLACRKRKVKASCRSVHFPSPSAPFAYPSHPASAGHI